MYLFDDIAITKRNKKKEKIKTIKMDKIKFMKSNLYMNKRANKDKENLKKFDK